MKDALGHGSDAGGGQSAENKAWNEFHKTRLTSGPHFLDPHDPRATLAQGHPKSGGEPVHPNMRGAYAQGGLSAPETRGLGIQSTAVFTARGNKGQNPRAWATAGQRAATDVRQKLFGRRN